MKFFDIFRKKPSVTIADKCCSCGVEISSSKTMCVSCERSENQSSNSREIFHMMSKEGQSRNFAYLGYTRYSPNRSSTCGYGSDDWFYLCEEKNIHYLLMFSDEASCGTGWMATELLDGDYDKLLKEDVIFWARIAYSKERTKFYNIYLTDIERVRHLLPTVSRCGKLADGSFMR